MSENFSLFTLRAQRARHIENKYVHMLRPYAFVDDRDEAAQKKINRIVLQAVIAERIALRAVLGIDAVPYVIAEDPFLDRKVRDLMKPIKGEKRVDRGGPESLGFRKTL